MAKSFNIFILMLIGVALLLGTDFLRPQEANAWELVTGRIKNLVEVNGKVQLTVITDPQPEENQTSTTSEISPQAAIDLELPKEERPPRLKEGDLIRIWQHSDQQLNPVRISYSRGYDPTGVRSRLSGRGRLSGSGRGAGKGGHGGR